MRGLQCGPMLMSKLIVLLAVCVRVCVCVCVRVMCVYD